MSKLQRETEGWQILLPIQKTVSFVGGFLRVVIPIALFIIFAVVVYHVKSRG